MSGSSLLDLARSRHSRTAVSHADGHNSRIQKASHVAGETALSRFMNVTTDMFKNEGAAAFYKGITPRVLRVAPGQAIVFTVSQHV